jgi:hypothetical protein
MPEEYKPSRLSEKAFKELKEITLAEFGDGMAD